MDEFTGIIRAAEGIRDTDGTVSLDYARREKNRQRTKLESGESIGIKLKRGTVMRDGDYLRSAAGRVIMVSAAAEAVSTVRIDQPQQLARVAYHLGNRHVWIQVGPTWLRYIADHVLDEMVVGLGCQVILENVAFEPEGGAYQSHGHGRIHEH
jgi:urease accessory protein